MTPEDIEAMNRASLVKNKGNAPSETSGGSQAPSIAGGGGEFLRINLYAYTYFELFTV